MANLLLTNYCNQKCEYCFAREKVDLGRESPIQNRGNQSLSLDDFEKCLDFLENSHVPVVSLLGGEPTLHPQFIELFERIQRRPAFSAISIFSNGLMPDRVVDFLETFGGIECSVIFNVNSPDTYPQRQWTHLNDVLGRLHEKGSLGYNIYRAGADLDYLLELFLRHRLKPTLRLGMAQPIMGAANSYLHEEDFPAVAAQVTAAARRFTDKGLYFSFDCGFPFCMFTIDQHRDLLSCGIKFESLCAPIIDIGTDLGIWRCFSLSQLRNTRLDDFTSRPEAVEYYRKAFAAYRQFGIYEKCQDCVYMSQNLCVGGCLSRVLRSFHENR